MSLPGLDMPTLSFAAVPEDAAPNPDALTVDLDHLITSRLLIQGSSGAGKGWAIRTLLEQTHGRVQQLVLDKEGEFSTLRDLRSASTSLCGGCSAMYSSKWARSRRFPSKSSRSRGTELITFYTDASSSTNADSHAIGIAICMVDPKIWATSSALLPFCATSLDAELIAICRAVLLADRFEFPDVCIRSDCHTAVSQFQGSPPRRSSARELWRRASRLARDRGKHFRLESILRQDNLAHGVAYQVLREKRVML